MKVTGGEGSRVLREVRKKKKINVPLLFLGSADSFPLISLSALGQNSPAHSVVSADALLPPRE